MLKRYRDDLGLKTVLRVAGGWVRDKVICYFIYLGFRKIIERY
jgi:hypothetical protein